MPEYLEAAEVEALIEHAPNVPCKLLMLIQWHAGLRISEALGLEARDVQLETDRPTPRVQRGKGRKARIVTVHPEFAPNVAPTLSKTCATTATSSPQADMDAILCGNIAELFGA